MAKRKAKASDVEVVIESNGVEIVSTTMPPENRDPALIRQRMLNQLRDETQEEIRRFNPTLRESEEEFREAKEYAASLKKIAEGNQKRMSILCDRMTQAMDGTYQFPPPPAPQLPFPEERAKGITKPVPFDTGAAKSIHELAMHGLTAKMCETLETHDVKTIGDLEALMRVDEWWHKKIKGFGGDRIDRTSDALLSFRRAFPVPSADDVEGDQDSAAADESDESAGDFDNGSTFNVEDSDDAGDE